ncbi:MAG TPA: gliding motility-associated C-terminal domain-containing protein [Saprospiraceae bacterium]|nr:gliding motility-associated C-terminal domain-containing protein [Saprospiraceae bacterium]
MKQFILPLFLSLCFSFNLASQDLSVRYVSSIGVAGLTEGCATTPDTICIQLTQTITEPVTIDVSFGGTATNITDYTTSLPDRISFIPGEEEKCFTLTGVPDEAIEKEEIVIVFSLNGNALQQTTIPMLETEDLKVRINQVSPSYICGDRPVALSASNAVSYQWSANSTTFDNPTAALVLATPNGSDRIVVTGMTGTCVSSDTLSMNVSTQTVMAEALDPVQICEGTSVRLKATVDGIGGGPAFHWEPSDGIADPSASEIMVTPGQDIAYVALIPLANCIISDTVQILVDPFSPALLTGGDTSICQGEAYLLAYPTLDKTTDYDWTPGTYLDDSTSASPVARPEDTTTYQVISTSLRGYCADTSMVTINIIPIDIELNAEDTIEICLGDDRVVNLNASDFNLSISVSPSDSTVIYNGGNTIRFLPEVSTTYILKISSNVTGCIAFDSIYVRVDSLPKIDTIWAVPPKSPYCEGDDIVLISPSYDQAKYPDIAFTWMPDQGVVMDENMFLNLRLVAQPDTITYTRKTVNHACMQEDFLEIPSIDTIIDIFPMDTIVCPGEMVQLSAPELNDPDFMIGKNEWSGDPVNLCKQCDMPKYMVNMDINASIKGTKLGCPQSGSATMSNFPPTPAQIVVDPPSDSAFVNSVVNLSVLTDPRVTDFTWQQGNQNIGTGTSIQVSEDKEGTKTYLVTFTDPNGCPGAAIISIRWIIPKYNVDIPNAFTPDGDGLNDRFRPINLRGAELEDMLIFNRFGQLVYQGNSTDGWDGTQGGQKAPSDTYAYIMKFKLIDGSIDQRKGTVILIR